MDQLTADGLSKFWGAMTTKQKSRAFVAVEFNVMSMFKEEALTFSNLLTKAGSVAMARKAILFAVTG